MRCSAIRLWIAAVLMSACTHDRDISQFLRKRDSGIDGGAHPEVEAGPGNPGEAGVESGVPFCSEQPDDPTCSCPDGQTRARESVDRPCIDIDECALQIDDCSPNAICMNLDGGYDCTCASHYLGDGRTGCYPDSCEKDNGGCTTEPMAKCMAVPTGDPMCACPIGYLGPGRGIGGCAPEACVHTCSPEYPCDPNTSPWSCRGQMANWPPAIADDTFAVAQDGGSTVTDRRNGLIWRAAGRTQPSGESYTGAWSEAVEYCDSLNEDGDDWRLPTIAELESLVDLSKKEPAINGKFSAEPGRYWTASDCVTTSGSAWSVDFWTGASTCTERTDRASIRCVRSTHSTIPGTGVGGIAPERYLRADSSWGRVVRDTATRLEWAVPWVDELSTDVSAYCTNLKLSNGGWRMPTLQELLTIVNRAASPAVDDKLFPHPAIDDDADAGVLYPGEAHKLCSSEGTVFRGGPWVVDTVDGTVSFLPAGCRATQCVRQF